AQQRPAGSPPPNSPLPPTGGQRPGAGPALAYSAVGDQQRPDPTTALPAAGAPAPAKPSPVTDKDSQPVTNASTARSSVAAPLNWNAVIAFVLSAIGLLSPVGIWLGYKTRRQIDAKRQLGREFATAAIIIGWLWIVFVVLGLLAYLWILI
ncbi:DUF4190 domain-containing protein, partial [Gordonia sihwensis]